MIRITFEDIIRIHKQSIDMYGGLDGLRDPGRIDSSINGMYQTIFGEEAYPELTDKASTLVTGIVMGHPFLDGNKRTGVSAMISFLQINGYDLEVTNEELIEFGLAIAQNQMDREQIKAWLEAHKKQKEKGPSDKKPNGLGDDE